MAQGREEGGKLPSPQAHLSSDAHAAAAELGRAARCARGVAPQPASRPAAAEENLLNKCPQRAGRAARGGGGPATARLLGVAISLSLSLPFYSDQWFNNSRSNDYPLFSNQLIFSSIVCFDSRLFDRAI